MKFVKEILQNNIKHIRSENIKLNKNGMKYIFKEVDFVIGSSKYKNRIHGILNKLGNTYSNIELIHVLASCRLKSSNLLEYKYCVISETCDCYYFILIQPIENSKSEYFNSGIKSIYYSTGNTGYTPTAKFVFLNIEPGCIPQLILFNDNGKDILGRINYLHNNWLKRAFLEGDNKHPYLQRYGCGSKKVEEKYPLNDIIDKIVSEILNEDFHNWVAEQLRTTDEIVEYIKIKGEPYFEKYNTLRRLYYEKIVGESKYNYDNLIAAKPKIRKTHTLDNDTKYWNILEVSINIIEKDRDRKTLIKLINQNIKDIIKFEVFPCVAKKVGEEYLKFLTVGQITFTQASELIITIQYKGDGNCPI